MFNFLLLIKYFLKNLSLPLKIFFLQTLKFGFTGLFALSCFWKKNYLTGTFGIISSDPKFKAMFDSQRNPAIYIHG